MEPKISAKLVRYAAEQVEPLIRGLGGTSPSPLPGLRIRLLDGNCIEKTEHRIKELRSIAAGPLPGKSLVVYDPVLRLPVEVFPCEDGHAQERSLLKEVLLTIKPDDVWIADRNSCTVEFTCGIDSRGAFFVIRGHKNYPSKILGKQKYIGKDETGKVYEQLISVMDESREEDTSRRIRVALNKKTRNGDTDIYIISNLPKSTANAKKNAELYRDRWTIETAFQYLAEHYNSEINTLGYPRAALFAFCVALVSYMTVSAMKSAIGSVYGIDVIEKQVSGYYVANEISAIYPGMMIAIDDVHRVAFRQMPATKLSKILKELAGNIRLSAFQKHPRGPKNRNLSGKAARKLHTSQQRRSSPREVHERTTLKGLTADPKRICRIFGRGSLRSLPFHRQKNQPTLLQDIFLYFEDRKAPDFVQYDTPDHGRIETRKIWTTIELSDYLNFPHVGQAFHAKCTGRL